MSSVDIQQIEQANKRAAYLNSERQRLLGVQESAKTAYEKALFAYEKKYGVKLTAEMLQEEYNKVMAETVKAFKEQEKIIQDIESGAYKQQQQGTNQGVVSQVVPQPSIQVTQQSAPLQQEQVMQSTIYPSTQQQKPPVVPPFGVQVQQPVQQTEQVEDISEQTFTPQGWGNINQNFNNILNSNNGTKFE